MIIRDIIEEIMGRYPLLMIIFVIVLLLFFAGVFYVLKDVLGSGANAVLNFTG